MPFQEPLRLGMQDELHRERLGDALRGDVVMRRPMPPVVNT